MSLAACVAHSEVSYFVNKVLLSIPKFNGIGESMYYRLLFKFCGYV